MKRIDLFPANEEGEFFAKWERGAIEVFHI
jgi:hypothetical protein